MERFKGVVSRWTAPLVRGLVRIGVSADMLTVAGFLGTCLAGCLVAVGLPTISGIVYLAVSALDFLDGAVARASGSVRPFGAFLDSLLDRLSEAAVLAGLVFWCASEGRALDALAATLALTGSFAVSYARARAEGLGYECTVGWLQRPERVVLLGVGMIWHQYLLSPVLWGIAILTVITVAQRGVYLARRMREDAGISPIGS